MMAEDIDARFAVLKDFLAEANEMTDDNLWTLALLAVGVAGVRAAQTGRADIHRACMEFVDAIRAAIKAPPEPKQ